MIVSCAGCGTKYRVSDDKIGPLGVKVRCPKCRTVFEVKLPEEEQPESLAEKLFGKDAVANLSAGLAAAPALAAAPDERPAPKVVVVPPDEPVSAAPAPQEIKKPEPSGRREPAVSQEPAPVQEPAVAATPPVAAAPPCGTPAAGTGGRMSAFPFKSGEEEPRILARALVSDILFYNRDSRDRGLAEGKTLAYMGREIARSWDTYKERVGLETAVETDFFRQAVNEILGEGGVIL